MWKILMLVASCIAVILAIPTGQYIGRQTWYRHPPVVVMASPDTGMESRSPDAATTRRFLAECKDSLDVFAYKIDSLNHPESVYGDRALAMARTFATAEVLAHEVTEGKCSAVFPSLLPQGDELYSYYEAAVDMLKLIHPPSTSAGNAGFFVIKKSLTGFGK